MDQTRFRGKSPEQASFFIRAPSVQAEASVLASLFTILDVTPTREAVAPGYPVPDLTRAERLCHAFESYLMIVPGSQITFEHAVLLLNELDRAVELQMNECNTCSSLVVIDALALQDRVTCGRCAEIPAREPADDSPGSIVRCFRVGDVEVRSVSDAKKTDGSAPRVRRAAVHIQRKCQRGPPYAMPSH